MEVTPNTAGLTQRISDYRIRNLEEKEDRYYIVKPNVLRVCKQNQY